MWAKKSHERDRKIQECFKQLEDLHSGIMLNKSESPEWKNLAEKSLEQKISVLRLWQAEDRMVNNVRIATASVVSAIAGGVVGFVIKFLLEKIQ